MEPQEPCGMNEFQAAKKLGLSVHTLRMWRREGRGPAYAKIGRRCIYMEEDLDSYIERCRIETNIGSQDKQPHGRIMSYEVLENGIRSTIAAFRVNIGRDNEALAFRCPFCLQVHFHKTYRPGLGECDDHWSAHCPHKNCFNAHGYNLVEVEDPELAGDLPKKLVDAALKHLSRQRLAELRKG